MASHFHLFPDRCWKFKKKERKKERKKEKKRKEKKRKEKKRKEKKERNPRKYVHIFYTFHTKKYGSTALVTHKHTVNDNLIL